MSKNLKTSWSRISFLVVQVLLPSLRKGTKKQARAFPATYAPFLAGNAQTDDLPQHCCCSCSSYAKSATYSSVHVLSKAVIVQIFQISSTMGSSGNLADNMRGAGLYPYAAKVQLAHRSSKAALNMGENSAISMQTAALSVLQMTWHSTMLLSTYLTAVRQLKRGRLVYEVCTQLDAGCQDGRKAHRVSQRLLLNFAVFFCAEMLSLANDLQSEGITVVSICPGHVKTDMGGGQEQTEAPESIEGMLRVSDGLSIDDAGKFFSYGGKIVPY